MFKSPKIILLFFLICIGFFISCKKTDSLVLNSTESTEDRYAKFFNVPSNTDALIKRCASELQKYSPDHEMIANFGQSYGYPFWGKTLVSKGEITTASNFSANAEGTDTLIYIPFAIAGAEKINGYILAIVNNGITFKYGLTSDYDKYPFVLNQNEVNATTFAAFMMKLNQLVYGVKDYVITDPRLFTDSLLKRPKRVSFVDTTHSSLAEFCISWWEEVEIWHDPDGSADPCDCSGNEYYLYSEWEFHEICGGGPVVGIPFPSGGGTPSGAPPPPPGGSGGGAGDPTGWNPDPLPIGGSPGNALNNIKTRLGLNVQQTSFIGSKPRLRMQLNQYLLQNYSANAEIFGLHHVNRLMTDNPYLDFCTNQTFNTSIWWEDIQIQQAYQLDNIGDWMIQYLVDHPNTPFKTFQNHFLTMPEGNDDCYDQNYWNNSSLTFPLQSLPSWANFNAAYPKHHDPAYDEPSKVYNHVGGVPASLYNGNPDRYNNTCAIRISVALNYSGVTIPAGPDRYLGGDGKYYFLSAAALMKWMKLTFGVPTGGNHLTGAQGGTEGVNFPGLVAGKQGLYIMIPNYPGGCQSGTGFCASGHADMMTNGECDGGCYFDATGGVSDIYIWELQ